MPISFLKSEKTESVFGSVFRRYVRLIWPILVINSIIYLCANTFPNEWGYRKRDQWGDEHSFMNLLLGSFVFVWFGDHRWNLPEWTMAFELWGSFLVFLTAMSLYNYRQRYVLYFLIMGFFLIGQI